MTNVEKLIGKIAILILLGTILGALVFPVAAQEAQLRDWGSGNFSTKNYYQVGGYTLARLIDTAQSRTIAKNPDKWKEVGALADLFYGPHPSVAEVHKFNLLMWGSVVFISWQMDEPNRSAWLWTHIGVETYTVYSNNKIGIKPDIPRWMLTWRTTFY